MARRDPGRWSDVALGHLLERGRWHRAHAADPQHRPDVLRTGGWPAMRWDRWSAWTAADPRWRVTTLDTTTAGADRTRQQLRAWVEDSRGARDAGTAPLLQGWCVDG